MIALAAPDLRGPCRVPALPRRRGYRLSGRRSEQCSVRVLKLGQLAPRRVGLGGRERCKEYPKRERGEIRPSRDDAKNGGHNEAGREVLELRPSPVPGTQLTRIRVAKVSATAAAAPMRQIALPLKSPKSSA